MAEDGPALAHVGGGIWAGFIPGMGAGDLYKFAILRPDGVWRLHADPLARWAETPPHTASRIVDTAFAWTDAGWLADRGATPPDDRPMSVYELHLGSWRPGLGYRELADDPTVVETYLGSIPEARQ